MCLWPSNLDGIDIYVNDVKVGYSYGCKDWYSETATGSIAVMVPLPEREECRYTVEEIAPGLHVIAVKGNAAKGGVFTNFNTLDMKHVLMRDVNGDRHIDAADAFAIQRYALLGAWEAE